MMLLPEMNRGVRGREGEKERRREGREGGGRQRGRESRDREIDSYGERQRPGLRKPRGYGGGAGCWTWGRNPKG